MMRVSHPTVHPVEVPPLAVEAPPLAQVQGQEQADEEAIAQPIGVRMRNPLWVPGTRASLSLRLVQAFFAVATLTVIAVTNSISIFSYLVAAAILQCLWSFSLAILDIYARLVGRSLLNVRTLRIFSIGDVITGTLTFCAAWASAGLTILIVNDFKVCANNYCTSLVTATMMAFISWFALAPSCVLNVWMASI